MRDRIVGCMKNIGLTVESDEPDFDVNEYIKDSITFITFIVELETEFDIEIPDEYLMPARLNTISNITKIFEKLINEQS